MFGASALVHLRPWTTGQYQRLIQLDMTAIFCCLAGTASAVAWLALHGASRWGLASGVWAIAAAGVVFVWLPIHPRAGVMNGLYLTGGWYPMLFCVPLWRGLGPGGFALLVAGGLCYTVGAVVVGAQRPDPWPAVFGYHEIFPSVRHRRRDAALFARCVRPHGLGTAAISSPPVDLLYTDAERRVPRRIYVNGFTTYCRRSAASPTRAILPRSVSLTALGNARCTTRVMPASTGPASSADAGATPTEQLIFTEETERARAPYVGCNFVGLLHAGPTLIMEANDEQRALHLPAILKGEHPWCQGFSEPSAGSDLASVQTAGLSRRRLLRRERSQDLDVLRADRRLLRTVGAHQRRRAQASRHLVAHHADGLAGPRGAAHPHGPR
jgi:channel protein (hemolysin III family)